MLRMQGICANTFNVHQCTVQYVRSRIERQAIVIFAFIHVLICRLPETESSYKATFHVLVALLHSK